MAEGRRTDLALEAMHLLRESVEETTELPGVIARERCYADYSVTTVEILNARGAASLGKPPGHYITLDMPRLCGRERADYVHAAEALATELAALLPTPSKAPVLVVGLGNRALTADAIGPKTVDSLLVTRHLIENMPEYFADFRPVSALAAGVMGDTGMESGELIAALVRQTEPALVIAVDALASRSASRMFTTIQISNTGIVPGSGIGNHRMAINEETLGVPVLAVGVPTVVDASTFCLDMLEKSGHRVADAEALSRAGEALFVTPKEVDRFVATLSKVLGLGISRALHVELSVEDVEAFLL